MGIQKGTLSEIRRFNRFAVLKLIQQHEPTSRADLAHRLDMSPSVVSAIVDELLAEGMVREDGVGESTTSGGRRPVILRFVPEARYALGIDVGGTKTIFALVNLRGEIVAKKKIVSHRTDTNPLEHIGHEASKFISELPVASNRILGTGIGVPGLVDPPTGNMTNAPGLGLDGVDIRGAFGGFVPNPIVVDNDVNMAVMGERWRGAAEDMANVVMLTIGTGIGAGLILSNQLYRGLRGYAGEIGYFQFLDMSLGEEVRWLQYGSLESMTSGVGIAKMAQELLPLYPVSVLHMTEPLTAEHVMAAAGAGDELAVRIVDTVANYLAAALSNVIVLLDPNVVIIGGGVAGAGDILLGRIRSGIARMSPIECPVVLATLGEDAGAVGAAATALIHTHYLELTC